MTDQENPHIGLPKWPAMVVVGEPVSVEQAAEICIRTSGMYFSSNDRDLEARLYGIIGVPMISEGWARPDYKALEVASDRLKALDLEYLRNSRIVSCWVGGPHGWCNWNGHIGTSEYNIGKWPGTQTVFEEWKLIAAAFPFLRLKCQLFSGETCEDGIVPIIQYDVRDGKVTWSIPSEPLAHVTDVVDMNWNLSSFDRESGIDPDHFKVLVEALLVKLNG